MLLLREYNYIHLRVNLPKLFVTFTIHGAKGHFIFEQNCGALEAGHKVLAVAAPRRVKFDHSWATGANYNIVPRFPRRRDHVLGRRVEIALSSCGITTLSSLVKFPLTVIFFFAKIVWGGGEQDFL